MRASPANSLAKLGIVGLAFDLLADLVSLGLAFLEIFLGFVLVIDIPGDHAVDLRERERGEASLNLLGCMPLWKAETTVSSVTREPVTRTVPSVSCVSGTIWVKVRCAITMSIVALFWWDEEWNLPLVMHLGVTSPKIFVFRNKVFYVSAVGLTTNMFHSHPGFAARCEAAVCPAGELQEPLGLRPGAGFAPKEACTCSPQRTVMNPGENQSHRWAKGQSPDQGHSPGFKPD